MRSFVSVAPHSLIRHVSFPSPLSVQSRAVSLLPASGAVMSIMDGDAPGTLILRGKSSLDNEIAKSLKSSNRIRFPDNDNVLVFLESELRNEEKEGIFQFEDFMGFLATTRFGRLLIWSPRLTSTHDIVAQNFRELPVGTVCISDVQLKGRGRSQNLWASPIGCLMFSFTIQMENGRVVPLLQYVISLAVTEAIKGICHQNALPDLDVKIKWPNDLFLNGLKIGGILCTSTYRAKKFDVSAGIGLNVDNDKPTTCLNTAMQALSFSAYKFRREVLVAAFFNKFEEFFDLFMTKGFESLETLYYKTWLHSGQRVIVQERIGDQMVENVVTIQGLTSAGYLLAVDSDNLMVELHPDGNSLDFFKGLVKRKLS